MERNAHVGRKGEDRSYCNPKTKTWEEMRLKRIMNSAYRAAKKALAINVADCHDDVVLVDGRNDKYRQFLRFASAAWPPQSGDTMLVTPSPECYYALSNFLRNSLVLFISFLYLCFFIFSFLCLLTLIINMSGRLIAPR